MPATRSRKRVASQDDQVQPDPPKRSRQTKKTSSKQGDDEKPDEPAKSTKAAPKSKKKNVEAKQKSDGCGSPNQPVKKTATKGRGKKNASKPAGDEAVADQDPQKDLSDEIEDESETKVKVENNVTDPSKVQELSIPLDDGCSEVGSRVYVDEKGTIYDASLNQTNTGANNNKFYRIQLLAKDDGSYIAWTRWGRVGEDGQSRSFSSPSLGPAMTTFEKKFKEKSGLKWDDRAEDPKPGKYSFLERSYEPESAKKDGKDEGTSEDSSSAASPPSELEPSVQSLISFIFNQGNIDSTMADLNYDAAKLPLGRLSESTILRGYQTLKNLSALFDDHALAASEHQTSFPEAVEQLSNQYYSFIPHAFGRSRPPVINSLEHLKKEVLLLESLTDLKDADSILKADDGIKVNILDARFKGLGLREMTPVGAKTDEYTEIEQYLFKTCGKTHAFSYELLDVFRIERDGEGDRYMTVDKESSDRRLLWHGSRSSNFGGILSQGLRIAPPEAPVSGYMFGKGVYLADMSSKSAQYCFSFNSQRIGLLLLCEAELGRPMLELMRSSTSAGEDAKAKGALSTWGQGVYGPQDWKDAGCIHASLKGVRMPDTKNETATLIDPSRATLAYNEYICYDVSQIRLRYLLRVRI